MSSDNEQIKPTTSKIKAVTQKIALAEEKLEAAICTRDGQSR